MHSKKRVRNVVSLALILIGAALIGLNYTLGGTMNLALPLVFIILGAVFIFLVIPIRERWSFADILYIPGFILISLGLILLLNEITQDYRAWAYAWLLILAAIGIGLLFANKTRPWHPILPPIGLGLTLAGTTFFVVFGAIAGGSFIQVMAPVLLVVLGISIRFLGVERVFKPSMREGAGPGTPGSYNPISPVGLASLPEPLSSREVEVLVLIQAGCTNQMIAERLHVAPSTVKTHINNLYGKLGVKTRLQAIHTAIDMGILSPDRM